LKAIIFDLDGTLYRQAPLRRKVMLRLARAFLSHPLAGIKTLRVLGAYRHAQETLRQKPGVGAVDLADAQIALACEHAHVDRVFAVGCVQRWMEREPLAYLARYMPPRLLECLARARSLGMQLAVLSDYPAEAKLAALGLTDYFEVVQSAQSPAIGVFKPDPRGLQVTMQLLDVQPTECLYVGDRADVDGGAALAAGVPCFILGRDGDVGTLLDLVVASAEVAQPVLDPA
jgi:beta-phosphoglucomutase-like phosphatase (HAD superfamily)